MACLTNPHLWVMNYHIINKRFPTLLYNCKRMNNYLIMLDHSPRLNFSMNCQRFLNSSSPDIIDSFTERLVQEKVTKWDTIKMQRNRYSSIDVIQLHNLEEIQVDTADSTIGNIEIEASINEFDSIIKDLIERDDTQAVLDKCIEHRCCPSPNILTELASRFSRSGEKKCIETLQAICKHGNEEEYLNQAEYKHYMAEATWVRGNLESSLEQFLYVYEHNATLRTTVRSMVKVLIEDVVTRRGEAQLVVITNFAKMLATRYDDLYFLTFIWQHCFMSEWFSDQQMATALMEEYEGLSKAIADRIPAVVMTSIRSNNVDTIQRLLEVLLRYGSKQQYGQVLRVYFDYKCNQGDLQTCSAIIRSSLELDVMLTANQHQRFLSLLLDRQHRSRSRQLPQPPPVEPFQFKF